MLDLYENQKILLSLNSFVTINMYVQSFIPAADPSKLTMLSWNLLSSHEIIKWLDYNFVDLLQQNGQDSNNQ